MLNTLFTQSIIETLTLGNTIFVIISALLLGLLISLVYMNTHKKEGYKGSFAITLIMLPAIIAMIILLVGNNVASAFSLAGAFSLIRFRSEPGGPKDVAYVFFTLCVGLACGMGFVGYATVFSMILCAVMIILTLIDYGKSKDAQLKLKILIPENLDYQGLFDDIFMEYTNKYTLQRVKTADFGALFEIIYNINVKQDANQKEFIDKLRSRNGNLSIALVSREIDSN